MKKCTKCSSENNDDVKFCLSCGTSLQTDLEKFLENQGISQLACVMKANDITSLEVLKELGEHDLGELGLAYGDKVRIKVAIESLKAPQQKTTTDRQSPAPPIPSLQEQGADLLRQTAQMGINKASAILNSAQQAVAGAPQSGSSTISTQIAGDDAAIQPSMEQAYNFVIWGWLTCNILTIVAWWKIFSYRKKVQSGLLRSHWNYQNKTAWLYVGLYIGLTIIAAAIEPAEDTTLSSLAGLAALVWYVRASWKGRSALKAGAPPSNIAVW
jgi:uncharacterized membrane protein